MPRFSLVLWHCRSVSSGHYPVLSVPAKGGRAGFIGAGAGSAWRRRQRQVPGPGPYFFSALEEHYFF
jgi:hypothetical protein